MTNNLDSNKLWNIIAVILKVTIGVLYVVAGIFVVKNKWFLVTLNEFGSWAFGILLVVYGIYRAQRAIVSYLKQ